MICVTLARPRHGMMIPEHRALAERGAELVELRLDALIRKVDLRRLLRERPCPVMITCRRPEDGGQFRRGENERRLLLRAAIAGGADYPSADYVDLELDVAGEIPRFGKTKRIVSYHNFQETPENLDEIHAQLAARDPDIVKLVTLANRPSDNVRMLKLVLARNAARVKTVGFCMGEIGLPSRILTGKYGAPFTYASSQKGLAVAPGQISFDELRGLYRYDAIGPETEVYGVIGDPIAHSLSPLIHNTAFREMGLNKVYLPLRVASADLAAFLEDARWLQLKGLSVTLPHKEAVRAFLAEADETVQATGAANTVIDRVGRWVGYNTDGPAAMQSLLAAFPQSQVLSPGLRPGAASPAARLPDPSLAGKRALVLGAGGVARAVVYGLKQHGAHVTLTSRTAARAEQLAAEFACGRTAWEERNRAAADILINCTSVGMSPDVDASPIDPEALKPPMVVLDTVYNPEITKLIQQARQRGCTTVTGVEMFVRQAAAQFRLFAGQDAPFDLMRQTVRQPLATR